MRHIRQALPVQPNPLQRRRCLTHVAELWRLDDRRLERMILILRLWKIDLGSDLLLAGICILGTGRLHRRR